MTARLPFGEPVLRRMIQTAQADRLCDSPTCNVDIRTGEDYTLYELGWPKTQFWARRRRHLRCTPTDKQTAIGQLENDLHARNRAGDFDGGN
jgi:hypothetical protein